MPSPLSSQLKLSAQEAKRLLAEDVRVLDLRPPGDFVLGHLPKAINLQYLRADFANRLSRVLPGVRRLMLCSSTDQIACDAASTLKEEAPSYQVMGCLAGQGVETWREAGLPLEQLSYISVPELAKHQHLLIIDVREPYEFYEAHIPGAFLLPWYEASESLYKVPKHRPIALICASEVRSSFVSSLFKADGREVYLVKGGMTDWLKAGLTIQKGLLGDLA
ncbi:MAG: rhodanese-like domain-containing protein [Deinococcales bacterium]